MSEAIPPPARRIPIPSSDRATVCRMLAVFSSLWDDGLTARPGVVMGPAPAGKVKVKVSLFDTDTHAIGALYTTSGVGQADVEVHVYDPLSELERVDLRAELHANPSQSSRGIMWAEWPARPASASTRIRIDGSVNGGEKPGAPRTDAPPQFVIKTDRGQFVKLVMDGAGPNPRVDLVAEAKDATQWSTMDACNEYRMRVIVAMQPNDRWSASSSEVFIPF